MTDISVNDIITYCNDAKNKVLISQYKNTLELIEGSQALVYTVNSMFEDVTSKTRYALAYADDKIGNGMLYINRKLSDVYEDFREFMEWSGDTSIDFMHDIEKEVYHYITNKTAPSTGLDDINLVTPVGIVGGILKHYYPIDLYNHIKEYVAMHHGGATQGTVVYEGRTYTDVWGASYFNTSVPVRANMTAYGLSDVFRREVIKCPCIPSSLTARALEVMTDTVKQSIVQRCEQIGINRDDVVFFDAPQFKLSQSRDGRWLYLRMLIPYFDKESTGYNYYCETRDVFQYADGTNTCTSSFVGYNPLTGRSSSAQYIAVTLAYDDYYTIGYDWAYYGTGLIDDYSFSHYTYYPWVNTDITYTKDGVDYHPFEWSDYNASGVIQPDKPTPQSFPSMPLQVFPTTDVTDTVVSVPTVPYTPPSGGGTEPVPYPPTSGGTDVYTPTSGSLNTGFYKVFNPTIEQVRQFNKFLWTDTFVEGVKRLFGNPMDAVLDLHLVYHTPYSITSDEIYCGCIPSGVTSKVVAQQFDVVYCGTVDIPEYYENTRDYSGYTDIQLYLPFVTIVSLDVNKVMGKKLRVRYNVDVLTGSCVAVVCIVEGDKEKMIASYNGNTAVQVPITSGGFNNVATGLISAVGNLATANIGGAVSSLVGSAQQTVTTSGSFGANCGVLLPRKPYVIISRRVPCEYERIKYLQTYEDCRPYTSLKGLIENTEHGQKLVFENCTYNNTTSSAYSYLNKWEIDELIQILNNGIVK